MNKNDLAQTTEQITWKRGQSVVIGSSVAGLVAAQVLSRTFDQVIVIDRDLKAGQPEFRPGAPQANHAHTLLPYGLGILERQFPGLTDELRAEGAVLIDEKLDTLRFGQKSTGEPGSGQRRIQVSASRPLLESILYRRVSSLPNVHILSGLDAAGLQVDRQGRRVTGLHLRSRTSPGQTETLPAKLVIDASGRSSRAPQWLESLGFFPPEEWRIDAHAGYASRIYRQPQDFEGSWKRVYVDPAPPRGTRGGVILPIEGGRWHVTLIGIDRDYPPADEDGFLAFAESLPVPFIYNAIRSAEPLTRASGYRKAENRVRRYENMPAYLEGFLVTGDAVFSMNPVYALGMTAAAASGKSLASALAAFQDRPVLDGLAARFQKQLAKDITALWRQAVESEWQWDSTEISDNSEEIRARMGQYEGV